MQVNGCVLSRLNLTIFFSYFFRLLVVWQRWLTGLGMENWKMGSV